jgi:uncharacterized membrane protein YfcA
MKWMTDKLALTVVAIACAAGAWALTHYSGDWFFPVVTLVAVLCFYIDNRRLRALLRQHNIDPRATRRQV